MPLSDYAYLDKQSSPIPTSRSDTNLSRYQSFIYRKGSAKDTVKEASKDTVKDNSSTPSSSPFINRPFSPFNKHNTSSSSNILTNNTSTSISRFGFHLPHHPHSEQHSASTNSLLPPSLKGGYDSSPHVPQPILPTDSTHLTSLSTDLPTTASSSSIATSINKLTTKNSFFNILGRSRSNSNASVTSLPDIIPLDTSDKNDDSNRDTHIDKHTDDNEHDNSNRKLYRIVFIPEIICAISHSGRITKIRYNITSAYKIYYI